jgi:hypothetical protein
MQIQIRIDFCPLDLDPADQKLPTKNRNKELSCFEVLNVLFRHQNLGSESETGSGSALT